MNAVLGRFDGVVVHALDVDLDELDGGVPHPTQHGPQAHHGHHPLVSDARTPSRDGERGLRMREPLQRGARWELADVEGHEGVIASHCHGQDNAAAALNIRPGAARVPLHQIPNVMMEQGLESDHKDVLELCGGVWHGRAARSVLQGHPERGRVVKVCGGGGSGEGGPMTESLQKGSLSTGDGSEIGPQSGLQEAFLKKSFPRDTYLKTISTSRG